MGQPLPLSCISIMALVPGGLFRGFREETGHFVTQSVSTFTKKGKRSYKDTNIETKVYKIENHNRDELPIEEKKEINVQV